MSIGRYEPKELCDLEKSDFKNTVVHTAIIEFLRQIVTLLNNSPDSETLGDLHGMATDGYIPSIGDITFQIEDRSLGLLTPNIISILDIYQYDPTNHANKETVKTILGSRIRIIYDEFNKRISNSINYPDKYLDVDTHFELLYIFIQNYRNNLWSNILPDLLAKNNFLDKKEKEKIIDNFRISTGFIESHVIQKNNPMDSGLNQLRAKLIQMDNRYLPYFNDDIKL